MVLRLLIDTFHLLPMRRLCERQSEPGDPFEAKAALVEVIGRSDLDCTPMSASTRGGSAIDRYGRTVARCSVNGTDLGEYMIAGGFAIEWPHR